MTLKPMFVLGLMLLFIVNALVVFGIGDQMPWNCARDYGGEPYYVSKCIEIRIMGMIAPSIGYTVALTMIFLDKESLRQIKKWQSALLCALFVLTFYIPSWNLFFQIDCPNTECSNLKLVIILLELIILPLAGAVGYWLPKTLTEVAKK